MFYAYYRVSTETQAEKGGGLETQRQNIEKYCTVHGITLDGEFTDAGISGAVKDTDDDDAISKRPALVELLATIQEGDSVIVLNTSRLWRSDTAKVIIRRELMKHQARVIAIENPRFDLYAKNPNDRFMDGIMELMDEWERLTIAMKLAKGRTAKAKNGDKPAGVSPFGYRYTSDKKHIEIDPGEAAAVRMMFSEAQKGKSLHQVADIINAQGICTRRGKEWSAGNVQVILRNRFYVGELLHQGKTIQGNHDAIISRVQFGKVSAQLDRRRRG
jgi:DNA invertase Pin-like site-specific DNA recombinase